MKNGIPRQKRRGDRGAAPSRGAKGGGPQPPRAAGRQDPPFQKEKSCGALVYRSRNNRIQLLIIRHKQGGYWSFPKGHVERGETERDTAMREVKEETGVTIQILDGFRQQVTYCPRPGISKDVVYFLGYAEDSRTVRQVEEVSELRWVNLEGAEEFLTYENDRLLLGGMREYLGKNAENMPGVAV